MKAKVSLATLALASFLPACAPRPTLMEISIDPSFSSDEIASIIAAGDEWMAKVPMHFTYSIFKDYCIEKGDEICIIKSQVAYEGVDPYGTSSAHTYEDYKFYATIEIFPITYEYNLEYFKVQAMHELGHAMGLVHHKGCFLMNTILDSCSVDVDEDAIEQWEGLHR